ncbi:glycoside hydrolase family 3 protein [Saccharothrix violaceirubra]
MRVSRMQALTHFGTVGNFPMTSGYRLWREAPVLRVLTVALVVTALVSPPAAGQPPRPQAVTSLLAGMTLEQKVGQLFVTYVNGQRADEEHPDNVRDFGVATPAEIVAKYRPGGVIYFDNDLHDNIDSPRQIAGLSRGLQRASKIPLAISTDQEMGLVTRIGPPVTQFPGNMALGAGRSTTDAEQAATITARELRALGVNQDFAPDADVNSNPANPVIGVRSYSGDPKLAAEFTAAQVRGYQQRFLTWSGVAATAKHFPGHGDTATDSHTSLPVVDRTVEQWREMDAPPFRAAIAAGVDSIMTAHILMPRIDPSGEPATLSKPVIDLLRGELGYDGVVITDALDMAGVRQKHPDARIPVLALKAGVDQLLMPPKLGEAITAVVDAVKSGELTERRIDQSVLRVLRMKFLRGILTSPPVDPDKADAAVGTPENLAAARTITDRTTTAVRNDGGVLPRRPKAALVTGWGENSTRTLAKLLGGKALPTGATPTPEQITGAVEAAGAADLVVVLTSGLSGSPEQQALVDRLVATGRPVVGVAVRNPYDVAYTSVPVWLATYSYGAGALESVAKVITGEIGPKGLLPVAVPGPTPYPLGHGLTW